MIIRKYTCKRYSVKFFSNTKLYKYVRKHHIRKSIVASEVTLLLKVASDVSKKRSQIANNIALNLIFFSVIFSINFIIIISTSITSTIKSFILFFFAISSIETKFEKASEKSCKITNNCTRKLLIFLNIFSIAILLSSVVLSAILEKAYF